MLLDSHIIIYAAEPGYDVIREFIAKHSPVISIISKVEVLGYQNLSLENKQKLEVIFQYFPVLPLSHAVIDKAILLRQNRKMSLGDALIAGTALIYNLTIVTSNVKDYQWIDDLEIINPLSK